MSELDVRSLDVETATALVDYAERPRIGGWSLRSALVRYAQLAPVGASAVLELVRRTDGALHEHRRAIERTPVAELVLDENGQDDAEGSAEAPPLAELLAVAAVLDQLGDALATWAHDRSLPPPHEDVRRLGDDAFRRLAALGVARETRPERRRASSE